MRNKPISLVQTVQISKVRLGALAKRVHLNKEYFIIEKDGVPIMGIMDIDEFEDYLELQDPKVQRCIEKGYQDYRAGKSRPARELLAELRNGKRSKANSRKNV